MSLQVMFWIVIVCNIVTIVFVRIVEKAAFDRMNVLNRVVDLHEERITNLEKHEL